jgi:hypothetical protein
MTLLVRVFACTCWLSVGTVLYARVWSRHLDTFPQPPEVVGRWVSTLAGLTGSDDTEQLTFYYVLIVSYAIVTLGSALAGGTFYMVRRRTRRHLKSH